MARISLAEFSRRYLSALRELRQKNAGLERCADAFAVNVARGLSKRHERESCRADGEDEPKIMALKELNSNLAIADRCSVTTHKSDQTKVVSNEILLN